jgi:hypothetical protein
MEKKEFPKRTLQSSALFTGDGKATFTCHDCKAQTQGTHRPNHRRMEIYISRTESFPASFQHGALAPSHANTTVHMTQPDVPILYRNPGPNLQVSPRLPRPLGFCTSDNHTEAQTSAAFVGNPDSAIPLIFETIEMFHLVLEGSDCYVPLRFEQQ